MSRSLKACPEGIKRAETALTEKGWSLDELAFEVDVEGKDKIGVDRKTVYKFFDPDPNKKSYRKHFVAICRALSLDWEAVAGRKPFDDDDVPEPISQADEPLAQQVNVPPSYVNREKKEASVKDYLPGRGEVYESHAELELIQSSLESSESNLLIIQGMAGIGKSELVKQLANNSDTHSIFPGGIFWAEIGHQSPENVTYTLNRTLQELIFEWTNTSVSPDIAGLELRRTARSTKARTLIIVDDIWHPEEYKPFIDLLYESSKITIIFTTRSIDIKDRITKKAKVFTLNPLPVNQAIKLLQNLKPSHLNSNENLSDLEAIAKSVDCHPMALKLLANKIDDDYSWNDLRTNLQKSKSFFTLEDLRERLRDSIKHIYKTEKNLYQCLIKMAIIPAGIAITSRVASILWNVSSEDAHTILKALEKKSLLSTGQSKIEGETYKAYNLLYEVILNLLPASSQPHALQELPGLGRPIAEAHTEFLERYRDVIGVNSDSWHDAHNDWYIYENICFHLIQAGKHEELYELLTRTEPGNFGPFEDPNPWMRKSIEKFHSYRKYQHDLNLALQHFRNKIYSLDESGQLKLKADDEKELLWLLKLHAANLVSEYKQRFYSIEWMVLTSDIESVKSLLVNAEYDKPGEKYSRMIRFCTLTGQLSREDLRVIIKSYQHRKSDSYEVNLLELSKLSQVFQCINETETFQEAINFIQEITQEDSSNRLNLLSTILMRVPEELKHLSEWKKTWEELEIEIQSLGQSLSKLILSVKLHIASSNNTEVSHTVNEINRHLAKEEYQNKSDIRQLKANLKYLIALLGGYSYFNEGESLIDALSNIHNDKSRSIISTLKMEFLISKIRSGHFNGVSPILEQVESTGKPNPWQIWVAAVDHFTEKKSFGEAYKAVKFLPANHQIVCLSKIAATEIVTSSGNTIDLQVRKIQTLLSSLQPKNRYYAFEDAIFEAQFVFFKQPHQNSALGSQRMHDIKDFQEKIYHAAISTDLTKDIAYLGYICATSEYSSKAHAYFNDAYKLYKKVIPNEIKGENQAHNQIANLLKYQILAGYTFINRNLLEESELKTGNLGQAYIELIKRNSELMANSLKVSKKNNALRIYGLLESVLNVYRNTYFRHLYHWELVFSLIPSKALRLHAVCEVAKILEWQDQAYLESSYEVNN